MSNKLLTRDEAFKAMWENKKVTHKSFATGEYLCMMHGGIYDESGNNFKGGWDMRRGGFWDTGWSIYNV